MKLLKIDDDGFYIKTVIKNERPTVYETRIDEDNNEYEVEVNDPHYIRQGWSEKFYTPKWNFETEKWEEGASQSKLDEITQRKQKELKNKIKQYRWEQQEYFEYDGHKQRFQPYDVQRMTDLAQALINGDIAEIEWSYPFEDTFKLIQDGQYLINMKSAGYQHEQKCRMVEKQLLNDDTVTHDNYKEKFDTLLSEM